MKKSKKQEIVEDINLIGGVLWVFAILIATYNFLEINMESMVIILGVMGTLLMILSIILKQKWKLRNIKFLWSKK